MKVIIQANLEFINIPEITIINANSSNPCGSSTPQVIDVYKAENKKINITVIDETFEYPFLDRKNKKISKSRKDEI